MSFWTSQDTSRRYFNLYSESSDPALGSKTQPEHDPQFWVRTEQAEKAGDLTPRELSDIKEAEAKAKREAHPEAMGILSVEKHRSKTDVKHIFNIYIYKYKHYFFIYRVYILSFEGFVGGPLSISSLEETGHTRTQDIWRVLDKISYDSDQKAEVSEHVPISSFLSWFEPRSRQHEKRNLFSSWWKGHQTQRAGSLASKINICVLGALESRPPVSRVKRTSCIRT